MIKKNKSLKKDIGYFLRKSRLEKSLTGYELGRILKLSQQQISRYERGVTSVNIETLDMMLRALDKNWADFCLDVIANHSNEISVILKYHKINDVEIYNY